MHNCVDIAAAHLRFYCCTFALTLLHLCCSQTPAWLLLLHSCAPNTAEHLHCYAVLCDCLTSLLPVINLRAPRVRRVCALCLYGAQRGVPSALRCRHCAADQCSRTADTLAPSRGTRTARRSCTVSSAVVGVSSCSACAAGKCQQVHYGFFGRKRAKTGSTSEPNVLLRPLLLLPRMCGPRYCRCPSVYKKR